MDNLFALIDSIRAEMPDISNETWNRIKQGLSNNAGGDRVYVPARSRKRSHLEALAEMNENVSAQKIAKILGVSVRHAQRLKRLR